LIIEVASAEEAVGGWRRRFDPQALLGVPPHVTVLYPFVPPDQINPQTLEELENLLAAIPPFEFTLVRTDWFGDRAVLWLAPEPPEPFIDITRTLTAAFPEHPPYGGQFDGTVPHLTVGPGGPSGELRQAERELQVHLPIRAVAEAVTLMEERPTGRWERKGIFKLMGPSPEVSDRPHPDGADSPPSLGRRWMPTDHRGLTR
jgi:2'-5' RNA ligase